MSARAKALQNLYRRNKITIEGLQKAVEDRIITQQELEIILNS